MNLLGLLLILGIFGSLSPALAGTHIRLLEGRNGLQRGLFFMVAYALVLLVLGVVLLATFSTTASPEQASGVTGVSLGLVGVLLLVLAFRRLVGAPDEDAPPENWLTGTTSASGALQPLFLGLAMPLLGVKNLAIFLVGIGLILGAGRSGLVEYPLLFLLVALFCLQLLVPFLVSLFFPVSSGVLRLIGGFLAQRRLAGGILQVLIGLFLIWIASSGGPPAA